MSEVEILARELQLQRLAFALMLVSINQDQTLSKDAVAAAVGLEPEAVGRLMEDGTFPYKVDQSTGTMRIPRLFVARLLVQYSKAGCEELFKRMLPMFQLLDGGQLESSMAALLDMSRELEGLIKGFRRDQENS